MGIDRDFPRAFAKSQTAAYGGLPIGGVAFVSVADRDKRAIVLPVLRLQQLGFEIIATEGTATVLTRNGIPTRIVGKYSEGGESVVDLINRDEVDLVINTPSGSSGRADGYEIRAATVAADKALFTTMAQLAAAVASIETIHNPYEVTSLQDYAVERENRR